MLKKFISLAATVPLMHIFTFTPTTDVLIVVDVQRDFLPLGSLATPLGNTILQPIYSLMHTAASHFIPIIASRDYHPSKHISFIEQGGSWPVHCVESTAGADFAPGFPTELVTLEVKKGTNADMEAYSAFEGSDLDAWLQMRGIKRVVIVGIATEYCVWSTARDAMKLGYETVIVADLIAEVDPAVKASEMQKFSANGLRVVQSSDLQFHSE